MIEILGLDRIPNYMHRKNAYVASFIIPFIIKERCGHGHGAEATHDSHRHTLNQNKSSITIQAMTNDTLLQLRKRCLTGMRTILKAAVYWRLLTSAHSGRRGGPGVLGERVEVTVLTSLHPLAST
jgi:hypothetical protein